MMPRTQYCKATKSLLEGLKSQLGDKKYKVIECVRVSLSGPMNC